MQALQNWRSYLPAKERLYGPIALLVITLLILGIFALVLFGLLPNARSRGELITTLTNAEQAVVLEKTIQANAPTRVVEQISSAETRVADAAGHFLSEDDATVALNQLYQYARVSGVTIIELNAQSTANAVPTTVSTVLRFNLQVAGTLPRLMNFLARIEETEQAAFALTNVAISPEKDRHIARMDLALYTSRYAAPGGANALTPTPLPLTLTPAAPITATNIAATPTPTAPTAVPGTPSFLPTVPLLPAALPTVQGECTNLVLNGDFEQTAAWLFSPSISPPQYISSQRQAGLRAMQLGTLPGTTSTERSSYSSVRQLITIPATANSVVLYWWQWAGTQEPPALAPDTLGDRQEVLLLGANERALAVVHESRQTEAGWQQYAADLSNYRGQSLYLYFNVFNNGDSLPTWLYLDEVVVRACGVPNLPTATPLFTTLPTSTPPASVTPVPGATATPVPGATATTAPGVTNTPTAVAGCRDLLINGGFEDNSGWLLGQSVAPPQYIATQAQAGFRAMQLGTIPGTAPTNRSSYSSVRQQVTIPASANYALLRWWQWAGTQESTTTAPETTHDRQEVLLLTPNEQVLAVIQRTRQTTGGWQEQTADLSPYRGRTVYLYFNVFNDSNTLATWLYVDGVALLDCVAPPAPTVVATATPLPTVPVATATTAPTLTPTGVVATATTAPTLTPTVNAATATATTGPTLTPTATGISGCSNLLTNGDFEGDTGWALGKTERPAVYTTDRQHGGTRSIQLGIPALGNLQSYSSISQQITIPGDADALTLKWWQWRGTEEATSLTPGAAADRQEVLLLTTTGEPLEVIRRERNNESGWQEVIIELNATVYRARTILVYFNVFNDGANGRTWMYIDDVALTTCLPQAVSTTMPTATSIIPVPTTVYAKCTEDPNAVLAPNAPIAIVGVDKSATPETVTLKNVSAEPVDVTNWHMCSITADQEHIGIGGIIPVNATAIFTYTGTDDYIWNNDEQDDGALYDDDGTLISYWEDPG